MLVWVQVPSPALESAVFLGFSRNTALFLFAPIFFFTGKILDDFKGSLACERRISYETENHHETCQTSNDRGSG